MTALSDNLPARKAEQVTGNQTLADILAKIVVAPATAAKQQDIITALGLLGTDAKLELIRALLAGTLAVSGPLTSAQLTAAGLATDAKLELVRALLAGTLTVSGPLTSAQLTAAGLATDAKLELVRLLLAGNLSAVAPPPTSGTVTIALGASLSDALQVDGKLSGIVIPAAWDTAAVTFLGSPDGAAYFPIYDAGIERSIASASVAANRMILLSLADWLGVKFVKVRSGTAAAAVPQTAARTLTLLKVA